METMESYSYLSRRVLDNGTRLIGHVPHIAPEAWFQLIFSPISENGLNRLEEDLGMQLPAVFRGFLQRCNGLRAFSGHLYVRGLRTSFARTGDAVWQPFSILTPNLDERPGNAKSSYLFIGGYEPNGLQLYIDTAGLRVYRCRERSAKPLHEWSNFETMLESEIQRLKPLFDREGRLLNPGVATTPAKAS
jgi:hypothetical protein